MKLRPIYKLTVLALAASAVALAASHSLHGEEEAKQVSADFRALTNYAETTRGSVLTVGGPAVEFALPPSANTVRILTNANLLSISDARAQHQTDASRRWQYAINLTLPRGTREYH